ncbi:HD domain-containing protein [Actinopolyspora mortivallis]|uniref:HD domain-containing protein n=1 Tax=Actinopolyspora mortivallis TaxID=33906 RepID=UPI0015E5AD97|nr:HD domain-containing protein [Actinopolyspora mortivallis]
MTVIAGVRIPDSTFAREARALTARHGPEFLLRHCERTYVFGRLATDAAGLRVREDLAYVAALLHDLGLTERYGGRRRFEVEGAEVAYDWARSGGLADEEACVVWDAIALHTSMGIAERKSPECALVHWGAGTDIHGGGLDRLDPVLVDEVLAAFPRDGFVGSMAEAVETAAGRAPTTYALTWLAATAERCHGAALPTSEDMLGRDPFIS